MAEKPIKRRRQRVPLLRRYTDLAAAIHVLQSRSLTLLDPERWDDGNDRYGLAEFKRRAELKSLLALCFAECGETYHHWRVFAPGVSGVCIEFVKDPLVAKFASTEGLQYRTVEYRNASLLKDPRNAWNVSDLPFLKRAPYEPEKEFRVIYGSRGSDADVLNVGIEMSWIKRVILSPWMPKALQQSIRSTLRSIDGCKGLTVQSTTLISSENWRRYVDGASSSGASKGSS